MTVKSNNSIKSDGLSYWSTKKTTNNNDMIDIDDEERSIAHSVSLLLKNRNITQRNLVQLPSHLVTSPNCQCHRSFHIFCTDLFPENDLTHDMINIHPAPRTHDRDLSHRVSTPYKKNRHRQQDHNQDSIFTSRSEPIHVPILVSDSQTYDKKFRAPPKLPPRTASLNVSSPYRSFQNSLKYSPSIRAPKSSTSIEDLQIRASSVFDQSPFTSQYFMPRGPPPSPKTPTQDPATMLLNLIPPAPLRAKSLIPCIRPPNENTKKPTHTPSLKTITYQDHARDYLSASDCSDVDSDKKDDDDDDDGNDDNDKKSSKTTAQTKPKTPVRTQSLSRTGVVARDRWISHNATRYLSLAEVYYSSLDVHKSISERSHRRLRAPTRTMMSINDNDDTVTTISKTTTSKTAPLPSTKSGFGFSKTASSMHFGYAADRLGVRESFEKWPQSLSHRTPIARKQEITALRLVTLPLVTS
ncbi:unnamed protein product [Rotaria socialis]|uniref:Uncharacterized protein n=1 Tax=Rotaria socialis TaxID=392032 RepID=A0A818D9C7_9BILA|nr:unnamed protein product [Rotaria socialis]CAF3404548.1 unnamed protein product [Rotaria socialis]CAF3432759.1 unnamed protein product [Rotaria socialis]CAF3438309.1 unnamed protein product [Rotaria socialis]CAF3454107.1 unnamed protein product [Rotaria socialis]